MSYFTVPNKSAGRSFARLLAIPFVLLIALVAGAALVEAASVAQATQATGIVLLPTVNVRAGDSVDYERIGQFRQGDRVTANGRNTSSTWLHVCCVANEQQGWLRADLLSVLWAEGQDINSLPIMLPPFLPQIIATPDPDVIVVPGPQVVLAPTPSVPTPIAVAPLPVYPQTDGVNPLTGLGLPGGRRNQRPLIVCVNNDYAARPQFGLSQADVVYEYLMEGYGITRFSAVFYGEDVALIGPVRSARIINHDLAALYNGLTACSGASDAVRYMMKQQSPAPYVDFDLDDPSATRYVVSIGSDYRTRMRTSTAMLRRYLADKGLEQSANLRGFTFGDLRRTAPPATTIEIPYPRSVAVEYRYDAGSKRYLRWLAGKPHRDGNSGQQIAAENVIIQFVPHENTDIIEDSLGSRSIRLRLIGRGRSIVMRDGQAFEGTWRSDNGGETPHFYDSAENEIFLRPGRTWISVVPVTYQIKYQ